MDNKYTDSTRMAAEPSESVAQSVNTTRLYVRAYACGCTRDPDSGRHQRENLEGPVLGKGNTASIVCGTAFRWSMMDAIVAWARDRLLGRDYLSTRKKEF